MRSTNRRIGIFLVVLAAAVLFCGMVAAEELLSFPAITETDIVYQKIDKILMDYIKQEKYLEIINKHINIIDKNLIIEKAKQSHVRKNTNNKFKFDYSIDFIFVIRKIIESLVEKNKIQFNSYDNLQQDLFNHFKQSYNS